MDPRLDRLFTTLEAQFGASIDRAEDEAASDLAMSLRQDIGLRDALLAGPARVITGWGHHPICEVAKDHVRVEHPETLIPLFVGEFETGGALRPEASDRTLAQLLRVQARNGRSARVETGLREVIGRVSACSTEHVTLQTPSSAEILIALAQVRSIRLFPED